MTGVDVVSERLDIERQLVNCCKYTPLTRLALSEGLRVCFALMRRRGFRSPWLRSTLIMEGGEGAYDGDMAYELDMT